jgi:hypothetical protein
MENGRVEGDKILKHPDREEIIKKLINGESVKQIEAWLRKKYPRTKRLHVSYMTLQKFRSKNLNIKGDLLEEVKKAKSEYEQTSLDSQLKDLTTGSNAYQEKINEIASKELDVTRRLLEMDKIISSRIEYYYNILAAGGNIKHDKIFIEYISMLKSIMQDWKKYVEGFADQKIEHNVNVQVVNTQVSILKEIVFETLQEMSPELVPVFIDKINRRLSGMDTSSPEYKTYQLGVIDVEPE